MKHSFLLLIPLLLASISGCNKEKTAEKVTIYYTNDIHSHVDGENTNFAKLKTLKDGTQNALLFDAGDSYQGTAYGSYDNGKTIHKIMEVTGYDLGTFGNHDFDFGMKNALEIVKDSTFPIIGCNLYELNDGVRGEKIVPAYKIFDIGNVKLGVIGICCPETIAVSSPKRFFNDDGEIAYEFGGSSSPEDLYNEVQNNIDYLKNNEKVDYVVALGHVGDAEGALINSAKIVKNTSGINAFIDGHSHSLVENLVVKNKDDNDVIITQTGSYFSKVGKMEINPDGSISTSLVELNDIEENRQVKDMNDELVMKIKEQFGQVVCKSELDFVVDLPVDGQDRRQRYVRSRETNMADFVCDAYYWYADSQDYPVDVTFSNGGGIRDNILKGEWKIDDLLKVNPYGNNLCVCKITGQALLDAVEFGTYNIDKDDVSVEYGGFFQSSGIKYNIDASIPSTVVTDGENWVSGPTGEYRVKDLEIYDRSSNSYVDVDLDKKYLIAGLDFILADAGGGFLMFKDIEQVVTGLTLDYLSLVDYVSNFPIADGETVPEIKAKNSPLLTKYSNFVLDYSVQVSGGRINIL